MAKHKQNKRPFPYGKITKQDKRPFPYGETTQEDIAAFMIFLFSIALFIAAYVVFVIYKLITYFYTV